MHVNGFEPPWKFLGKFHPEEKKYMNWNAVTKFLWWI